VLADVTGALEQVVADGIGAGASLAQGPAEEM
jgi:hypothetical protein